MRLVNCFQMSASFIITWVTLGVSVALTAKAVLVPSLPSASDPFFLSCIVPVPLLPTQPPSTSNLDQARGQRRDLTHPCPWSQPGLGTGQILENLHEFFSQNEQGPLEMGKLTPKGHSHAIKSGHDVIWAGMRWLQPVSALESIFIDSFQLLP